MLYPYNVREPFRQIFNYLPLFLAVSGSEANSLANLGSLESSPQATSPTTTEMRELLDRVQQLPHHQRSLSAQTQMPHVGPEATNSRPSSKSYFHKAKAKTMYVPLESGGCGRSRASPTGKIFSR